MASLRSLAPLVRRSVVATRSTQYSLRGGASPPLPPFARSPVPTQKVRFLIRGCSYLSAEPFFTINPARQPSIATVRLCPINNWLFWVDKPWMVFELSFIKTTSNMHYSEPPFAVNRNWTELSLILYSSLPHSLSKIMMLYGMME